MAYIAIVYKDDNLFDDNLIIAFRHNSLNMFDDYKEIPAHCLRIFNYSSIDDSTFITYKKYLWTKL